MKLILQIAAGVILAWFIIRAIELTAARVMINQVLTNLPPPRLSPTTTTDLDAAIARDFENAQREHDARFQRQTPPAASWSIITTDGRTYTGAGRPPSAALDRTTKPAPAQDPAE